MPEVTKPELTPEQNEALEQAKGAFDIFLAAVKTAVEAFLQTVLKVIGGAIGF